ncbi:MAG: exodeoxyribonuclease VII large subunit [Turicibacter sp.]
MEERQPLTVKALTKYIKLKFDYDKNLQHLHLKGEISNFKRHSRGHLYFTLKDDEAQISSVMFASSAQQIKFIPQDGMQVIVKGNIAVYEAGGSYSLYVKEMIEDGVGNLFIAFNLLKQKLQAEGLFEQKFKKPIPMFPKAIGVVTSPTGAAIKDILSTIKRRYPLAKIYIYPALVQGEKAANSIVSCIEQANEMNLVDTLIVGRGGGSIEDLWSFNEEIVARAIFNSDIPIISAVGHETDFTIADFVADHRAPTPTGAAEIAVPNLPDVLSHYSQLNMRLNQNFNIQLERKKKQLTQLSQHYIMKNPNALFEQRLMYVNQLSDKLQYHLQDTLNRNLQNISHLRHRLVMENPIHKIERNYHVLSQLNQQLTVSMNQNIVQNKQKYGIANTKLQMLNPLAILSKGYSVVTNEKNEMIKSVSHVKVGQSIQFQLDDGLVKANVVEVDASNMNVKG